MKPKIIFFSRSYQTTLFPKLDSEKYESIHVTLTKAEKEKLGNLGIEVKYCFESYTGSIEVLPEHYLKTSFLSDRFLNKYNLSERHSLLKKEISFWSEIFDCYKPIAVLNEQVAIEIAEVMYIEAQKRDIKYLAWMTNPVNGYFYWIKDPISLSLDDKISISHPSENSINLANEYIKRIVEKNERPYYIMPFINQKKLSNLISATKGIVKLLINNIKGKNGFYEDCSCSSWSFFERSVKAYFINYDHLEDLGEYEVILYPLHYEPEASLSYLSEFYSNQIALIENITKCLKNNSVLVVKEHPAQAGMLLTKKYQDLLKNNSQLIYLPSTISSYEIIRRSKVIITLTSHLGWEALILGKPVYLLGKMFYDRHPYVNKFRSFEDLKSDLLSGNYKYPTSESNIDYIAKMLEISHKGMPFPCDDLYKTDNIKNIVSAIEKELSLA